MPDENDAIPDFANEGIAFEALTDGGMVRGRVGDDPVVLARRGSEVFALGASCTHYEGALDEGVFDGTCIRCPLHHSRFDVHTGEAVAAPALNPVTTYGVR